VRRRHSANYPRRSYPFRRLLVGGPEDDIRHAKYHSNVSPQSIIGSLATWEIRFNVPVVFSASAERAARQLERWAFCFAREIILSANSISTPKPGH
jgi:hypothetical protein